MPTDVLQLIFSQLKACHLLALNWTCHYLSRLILKWMPPPVKQLTLQSAAYSGTLSLFQWVEPFAPVYRPPGLYREAASGGRLEILLYLGGGSLYPFRTEALTAAASAGRLNILDYWLEKEPADEALLRTYFDQILLFAIENHQTEVVKWALPHCSNLKLRTCYCAKAALHDDFEILKILRCNDFKWCFTTFECAIKGAALPMLNWLVEQNCPQIVGQIEDAIEYGRIETLKWLRQKGCEWCHWPMILAIIGGQMEMLVYLREEERFGWVGDVCAMAIKKRRLDMLQYVRGQGCAWGGCDFLLDAPEEIQRWSYENGCPVDEFFARLVLPHHPEWKRNV